MNPATIKLNDGNFINLTGTENHNNRQYYNY